MNDLLLLVEGRNCLFPSFLQFLQYIDRTCYLGEFVDGRAVMFKNITSYLSVSLQCVSVRVFLPARLSMAEPLCLET